MDMVVRLKLDDTETLLVGLRHEGQKVIVDVKASNDGLVNLLQAHKDDIARHLKTKTYLPTYLYNPTERGTLRDRTSGKTKKRTASKRQILLL